MSRRNTNQTIITHDDKGYWLDNEENFEHFDTKEELIQFIAENNI